VTGELIGWNLSLRSFDPTIPLCDSRHGVGSALVVRKDGKPFCHTHVSAFVEYARSKIVSHCHENRDTARGVLENCSRGYFLTWYAQWKSIVTGVDVDVPSPYEVEFRKDSELTAEISAAGVQ
jgi:hypothetical protein